MSDAIKTEYRGVEIVYLEDPNRWRFTANGRERSAESLVKAREAIDRALDDVKAKKEKPWEPFDAIFNASTYNGSADYLKVKVTSVAEERSYSGPQVWISNNGKRSKEALSRLFKDCPENEALIAEMVRLQAEREAIDEQMSKARGQMIRASLPAGD